MTLFSFGCDPRKPNDNEVSDSSGNIYEVVVIEDCQLLQAKASELVTAGKRQRRLQTLR